MVVTQRSVTWRRVDVALVIGLFGTALAVAVAGATIGERSGGGHAILHATTSAALFGFASVILVRRPRPTIASRAPALGLVVFGAGTLVEAVGALGFVGDERTGLAIMHDLGLGLSQLGMVALIVGGAIGLRALVRHALPAGRLGSAVAAGVGVGALVGGLLVLVTLVGLAPLPGS